LSFCDHSQAKVPGAGDTYYVALTGNPNVGKSSLFNDLTGGEVYVANWPGVTVDLKYGSLTHHGINIRLIDLPGSYSLTMGDEAEKVVRDFILNNKPDLYVVITDMTALERTIYPAIKLLEAFPNVLIVLNMADIAKRRALHVDIEALERSLNTYLVKVSALSGEGLGVLLDRIVDFLTGRKKGRVIRIDYGPLEPYIHRLEEHIKSSSPDIHLSPRWVAIELLEGDKDLRKVLIERFGLDEDFIYRVIRDAEEDLKIDLSLHIIRSRYGFISRLLSGRIIETRLIRPKWMEALDTLFLKPYIGALFSLLILFVGFMIIFTLNTGFPLNIILDKIGFTSAARMLEEYSLVELVSLFFSLLSDLVGSWLFSIDVPEFYILLITDGLLAGVGAVVSFLPLVFLVFILNSFLQDTGLYTRIAVSLHDAFRRFGLSGKSIYPVVVGFGCNVPGILATRGLDDDRERTAVVFSLPFIPCQARLVVLLAISSAISSDPFIQAFSLLSLYMLSILLYLITSKLLTRRVYGMKKGPELLMELPPYHSPHIKVLWWYSKFHTIAYLKKAGSIILIISLVMWLLLHTGPVGYISTSVLRANPGALEDSYAAFIGKILSPIMGLIGLGDWRAILALEAGFFAKEGVISAVATITGVDNPVVAFNLIGLTKLQLYILAVFMSIYTPCLPAITAIKSELGRFKHAFLVVSYELVIAYMISFIIYKIAVYLLPVLGIPI